MPVKSTIQECQIKTPKITWHNTKYPCIGTDKYGKRSVLFTSYGTGTVISEEKMNSNSMWGIGHWSQDWAMDSFSITPKNKQFVLSNI